MVSGETMPASGNSLATWTTASPSCISTTMTVPPGSGMRLRSSAPKACAYQSMAADASGTTRCTLSFTRGRLGPAPVAVLYV